MLDSLIVVGIHFSSKAELSKQQTDQFKVGIMTLKQAFPEHHIVVGGDINSFMEPDPALKGFEMFPDRDSLLTTVKMRTWTQAQFHKRDTLVKESKDKILTTLRIE